MAETMRVARSYAVNGNNYVSSTDIDADVVFNVSKEMAAAKTGALTTRTNNTDGTLTMDTGHGITTGARLDLYWDGGSRYGVTVGTVSTNSVPISSGTGDNLPVADTEITAQVPNSETTSITGANVVGILLYSQREGYVVVTQSDNTVIVAQHLTAGSIYAWTSSDGTTNPVTGVTIGKVFMSQADSDNTGLLRASLLYN